MARLRYVKRLEGTDSQSAATTAVRHTVRSLRALYETEPEIARALLPRPLEPAASPEVFVQFANVAMHLSDTRTVEIGAATVGVACRYEGNEGYYVLAMPMEGEFVVIGGREKYGEPKKLAQTAFRIEGDRVNAQVTRHGVTFLELEGRLDSASDAPLQFAERFYCYKAMPAAMPDPARGGAFDGEVFLTELTWERDYARRTRVAEGRVILRESAHDPIVDVPVKRLVSMELAEGASKTSGKVLRTVPGDWLEPFLVQRYDEPQDGIVVELASERDG